MATSEVVHAHAAPQGFIRQYIFSLDHKIIGIQYFFLALTAVWVGMILSLLMRIHLIWPDANLPLIGHIQPETYLSLLTKACSGQGTPYQARQSESAESNFRSRPAVQWSARRTP